MTFEELNRRYKNTWTTAPKLVDVKIIGDYQISAKFESQIFQQTNGNKGAQIGIIETLIPNISFGMFSLNLDEWVNKSYPHEIYNNDLSIVNCIVGEAYDTAIELHDGAIITANIINEKNKEPIKKETIINEFLNNAEKARSLDGYRVKVIIGALTYEEITGHLWDAPPCGYEHVLLGTECELGDFNVGYYFKEVK